MVRVVLFAAAAQAAGRRLAEGPWAGLTAGQLLERLAAEHPGLKSLQSALLLAVNQEFASPDRVLQDGDEVAVIPPVSGGSPLFEVTAEPLSSDAVQSKVIDPHMGAVCVFVGTVREWTRGKRTVYLEYEAYEPMALRQMEKIAAEISERWPGAKTAISHRTGKLEIGEASVVIAVATPHRGEAFEACRHAIERLKQIVPIWKKEIWEDGETWVGAQVSPH